MYYKEAVGAFVVFDITRNSSFEAVKKWKQDIDSKARQIDIVVFSALVLTSAYRSHCTDRQSLLCSWPIRYIDPRPSRHPNSFRPHSVIL